LQGFCLSRFFAKFAAETDNFMQKHTIELFLPCSGSCVPELAVRLAAEENVKHVWLVTETQVETDTDAVVSHITAENIFSTEFMST
jgi:hypothetical protein